MGVRLDRLRGKGRWRVDFTFKHPSGRLERVREVSPVNTKRGAERYEHELREAMLQGLRGQKEAPTLQKFSEDFLRDYAEAENKPSEVDSKRRFLRKHILPVLGGIRLDELTRKDIDAYKREKLRTLKAKSINNHLAVLSKLLGIALEWEVIEKAPLVKLLKVAPSEFRWLTEEEAQRLASAADDQWRTMVFTGLRTGLRLGELRALRWQDVDLDGRRVIVRQGAWKSEIGTPKGGRAREVHLGDEICASLRAHPKRLRCELVFPGADGGLRETSGCVWALRRFGVAAGLGHVGWHVLRHTFASHLVQKGVKILVVRDLLGHADIRTTMRYAHLAPDAGRAEVMLLDGQPAANEKKAVSK